MKLEQEWQCRPLSGQDVAHMRGYQPTYVGSGSWVILALLWVKSSYIWDISSAWGRPRSCCISTKLLLLGIINLSCRRICNVVACVSRIPLEAENPYLTSTLPTWKIIQHQENIKKQQSLGSKANYLPFLASRPPEEVPSRCSTIASSSASETIEPSKIPQNAKPF